MTLNQSIAQDAVIQGLTVGTHYWKVVVRPDGRVSATPLQVVTLGPPTTPTTPTDPGDPDQEPDGDPTNASLARVSYQAARKIDKPDEARLVQQGVVAMRTVIQQGNVPLRTVWAEMDRVMRALYLVMGPGGEQRWRPWLNEVQAEVGRLNVQDKNGMVQAFSDISLGLSHAIGQAAVQHQLNPGRILRLVTAVIAKDWGTVFQIVIEIIQERRGGLAASQIDLESFRVLMDRN